MAAAETFYCIMQSRFLMCGLLRRVGLRDTEYTVAKLHHTEPL